MVKPKNVYDAYWWIVNHPALISGSSGDIEIKVEPTMVNPTTKTILPIPFLNTQINFWVEICSKRWDVDERKYFSVHHWELDTGGDTYDDAIWNAYYATIKKYGDYPEEKTEMYESIDFTQTIPTVSGTLTADNKFKRLDMDKIFYPLKDVKVPYASYSPFIRGEIQEPMADDLYPEELDSYDIEHLEYEIETTKKINIELQKYVSVPKRPKEYVDAVKKLIEWNKRVIYINEKQIEKKCNLR